MEYLRDVWYPIGVTSLIQPGRMLRRVVIEEAILLFRAADGQPVALRDRCPHRFAPLSAGRFANDEVTCTYHGLRFGRTGACVSNPHGDGKIPSRAVVKQYPIVDRYGMSWLWLGETSLADPAAIPDLSFFDNQPSVATRTNTLHSPLHYRLLQDNLLDLSHVDHLHTWFKTGGLSGAKAVIREQGTSVHSVWEWQADAGFAAHGPFTPPGPVDSWVETIWHAPSVIVNRFGSTPRGRPRAEGLEMIGVHFLAPETEFTTHYSQATVRNFEMNNRTLTDTVFDGLLAVNDTEDTPMILKVQEEMGTTDLWSLNPVLLPSDAGPVRARRIAERMLKQEAARREAKSNVA